MVPVECINKLKAKTCEIASNIKARAKSVVFGGGPCCDTRASDLRWYLALYLVETYGNYDATKPPSENPRAIISDADAECICKWVDRQFPNE